VAADYDGDRVIDLVVNNEGADFYQGAPVSTLTLLRGDGAGGFKARPGPLTTDAASRALVAADFNGDQRADFALANSPWWEPTVLVSFGPGSYFRGHYTLNTPSLGAAVGDFNRDGLPDLAFSHNIDSVSALINDGQGGFQIVISFAMQQEHIAGGPA